ncbi:protein FAM234A isoform X2 [Choloepus didactylus]|uniref:protein FAM234A isoform X2 n=1 Tax=Choloepus didactylus TaxID=27675 RepID=UPI00189FB652|nr:protein FAM234A isoform X2 [Choloepus didactylus]
MMENKDLEAEIHPLRNEARKSQENLENQVEKEETFRKSTPPQSRLSRCRTVAFFLSLFVCLLVIFIISFIIPCPERPVSQRMWRVDYNTAVALNFLAMEDVNRDRIQDVLFLYKNINSSDSSNRSCASEGFSTPCTIAAAVSGASGSLLWERAVAQDVALVECSVPQLEGSGASPTCVLVDVSGAFTALDPLTGDTLWSRPSRPGTNVSVLGPVLRVPDGDGDGTPDLLVLTREEEEVGVHLYSGSSGLQIGRRGSLGCKGTGGPLLHVTRTGAHYLLVPCASALCGRSVKRLYEEVTGRPNLLKTDPVWERRVNTSAPRMPLHSSGTIRFLMSVPGKTGEDVLLVGSEACVLLDRQELTPTWAFGATQVLSSHPGVATGGCPRSSSPPRDAPADSSSLVFQKTHPWSLHSGRRGSGHRERNRHRQTDLAAGPRHWGRTVEPAPPGPPWGPPVHQPADRRPPLSLLLLGPPRRREPDGGQGRPAPALHVPPHPAPRPPGADQRLCQRCRLRHGPV